MRLRFRGWDRHNTVHEHPITPVFYGESDEDENDGVKKFIENGSPEDALDFLRMKNNDESYWVARGTVDSIRMTGKYIVEIQIEKKEFFKYVHSWLNNEDFKLITSAIVGTFWPDSRLVFNEGQTPVIATETSDYRSLIGALTMFIDDSLRLESLIEDLSAAFGDLEKDHDDKIPGLFLKLVSSVTDALNKRKERLADQE